MTQKILGFITYDPKSANTDVEFQKAMGSSIEACRALKRAQASSYTRQFQDILPNVSVRDGFNRTDYEYYRSDETVPQTQRDIMRFCMDAYRSIGIVRNVIDLMSDFATQGMQLVHPNRQIQKFYRGWWDKVRGKDRSERMVNLLCRAGNVVTKRVMAKATPKMEEFLRSVGEDGLLTPDEPTPTQLKSTPKTIPIRYDFINPLIVEVAGGIVAQFTGRQAYAFKIPYSVRNALRSPKDELERALIEMIPENIMKEILGGKDLFVPDQDKIRVLHYKKDDWQDWADPMIYAIYKDLVMLEKMKLADLAALDGAISQVRIWKLGDLEKGIFPTDTAINKLIEILMSNPGGGAFDIVWGPDLKVEGYKTDVHQFLGGAKYEPVLGNIYAGLGVPPTLTGAASGGGFTNNYISLKTLVQRLEYVRSILLDFWNLEIKLVQQAMQFRFPATVTFDRMVLSDEAAEKKLLMDLADRLHISEETLRERFGESDEIETLRLRREQRERDRGTRTQIGGPWMTAEKEFELSKLALTRTLISPHEAGLDIEEKYKQPPFLMQLDKQGNNTGGGGDPKKTNKGVPGQGRPKNTPDSYQRDRTVKVRTSADSIDDVSKFLTILSWAKAAQAEIGKLILPSILQQYNKSDIRSLTEGEFNAFEDIKFRLLANIQPLEEIGVELLEAALAGIADISPAYYTLYDGFITKLTAEKNNKLTVDDLRYAKAAVYALINS